MKHPMRPLLLLLLAAVSWAADPDDESVPVSSPTAAAVVPAHQQDPAQARADAIHAAQGKSVPAADARPVLPADPMRGGYPESAHRAFAARHAIETRPRDDTSLPYAQRLSAQLHQTEMTAYATCLNLLVRGSSAPLPKNISGTMPRITTCS